MSDTESEQEYGPTTQFVPPRPSSAPETILDAIEQLSQLTLPALDILVKDTQIHEIITRASSDILSFLDSFQALVVQPNEGAQQRLLDFAALVDVQFFATLFGQRKVFHRIASQGTKHAVVCWVDAILAKIGDASVSIATGVPFDELNPALSFGKTIQEQEEDALAAAAQLPADWEDVFCIIASEEPSPAARRLALRLSFAAFILAPALSRKPNQHPHELLEVLEKCVTHTRGSRYTTSAVGTRLAVQERLGFGMIACLFATSDRQSQSTRGRPTTRPHTLGSLLGLIQEVIHPQDTVASLSLVKPEPTNLDEPIRMLLTWGNVTSWCWHVWDDHRVANSESIVYLTSLFLQSSDPPAWNFANRASSIAILRVLHHIVLTLTSHLTGAVCPVVMKNACLYAVRCVQYATSSQKDEERWIGSDLCKRLLSLFVLLDPKPANSDTSDLILEALCLFDTPTLALCLAHAQQDLNLRFAARLNDRLVLVRNFVSTNTQVTWHTDGLEVVRATLNFLSILWSTKRLGSVPKQPAVMLLTATTDFLLQNNSSRDAYEILGDAALTAFAMAKNEPTMGDLQRDSLWKLALSRLCSEVRICAAFAHYIVAVTSLPSSLSCAEAGRYLAETLLLILRRNYIDDSEPLALLVCPMICRALLRLLQADAAARQFTIASPLTLSVCRELERASADGRDDYARILKCRVDGIGACLFDAVRGQEVASAPSVAAFRIAFYRSPGAHMAILVD